MIVGVFYFELYIPGLTSLKEKRSIIKSLKQRLKNNHNISISEVGFQDKLQRCGLGISLVSLSQQDVDKVYNGLYEKISSFHPIQIARTERDSY